MFQKFFFFALMLWNFSAHASLTFKPTHFIAEKARLVVVIHGCLQSAENMALGTGWNQIAEKENLVVLYPQVPASSNALDCWNWFLPENQTTEKGQLLFIRDEVASIKSSLSIPKENSVFVTGISSGGATAAGLLACFPNDFAAGAIHSGVSYGLAQNFQEGNKVLKEGPGTKTDQKLPCQPENFEGSVFVIHGTDDKVVHPRNAERIFTDFLPEAKPVKVLELVDNGLPYSVSDYFQNGKRRGQFVNVRGLAHAWSGSNLNQRHSEILGAETKLPYFSDKGPSATNLIWKFFKQSDR